MFRITAAQARTAALNACVTEAPLDILLRRIESAAAISGSLGIIYRKQGFDEVKRAPAGAGTVVLLTAEQQQLIDDLTALGFSAKVHMEANDPHTALVISW